MEKFENKKFAVILFLAGVVGIVIAYILSESYYFVNGGYYKAINANYSLENRYEIRRVVEFFHLKLPFKAILVFLILAIATSIYWFLYKTDESIKNTLNTLSVDVKTFSNEMINSSAFRKVFSFYISDSDVKIVQLTKGQSALEEIMSAKNNNILLGVLFFVLQLFLMNISVEYVKYFGVLFIVSLGIRFFAAYRCNKIAEYNIWGSGAWFFLGFILPSIALILSGLKSTLRKNIEQELEEGKKDNDFKDMNISPVGMFNNSETSLNKDELLIESHSVEKFDEEKKTVSDVYNQIKNETGVEPDFKSLVEYMVKRHGRIIARDQFNIYVLGWQMNDYAQTDFRKVHDSIFKKIG